MRSTTSFRHSVRGQDVGRQRRRSGGRAVGWYASSSVDRRRRHVVAAPPDLHLVGAVLRRWSRPCPCPEVAVVALVEPPVTAAPGATAGRARRGPGWRCGWPASAARCARRRAARRPSASGPAGPAASARPCVGEVGVVPAGEQVARGSTRSGRGAAGSSVGMAASWRPRSRTARAGRTKLIIEALNFVTQMLNRFVSDGGYAGRYPGSASAPTETQSREAQEHTPCPRPSVSTSAPPTRSSPSSRRGEPVVIPNAEGARTTPVGRRLRQERRGPRRRGRQAPGHHQPRPHHPLGQAPHGHQLDHRHRRQEVHAAGDLRPHAA